MSGDATIAAFGGTLTASTLNLSGATSWTTGRIDLEDGATVSNTGTLTLGTASYSLVTATAGSFSSSGAIEFTLANASSGAQLSFDPGVAASIAGDAVMTPSGGYTPTSGDTFEVLRSASGGITGSFSSVTAGWSITSATTGGITVTRD